MDTNFIYYDYYIIIQRKFILVLNNYCYVGGGGNTFGLYISFFIPKFKEIIKSLI